MFIAIGEPQKCQSGVPDMNVFTRSMLVSPIRSIVTGISTCALETKLATGGVPIDIWWSRKDKIVELDEPLSKTVKP